MLISLYTSRVVLSALGVNDYGIYNVVGGVVSMFTMISGALNASISRFITFELGTGDFDRLKRTFSTSVTIQILLAIIIILLSETIGLWYLNNMMVMPSDRLFAANIVYQLSILTFVINLISVPYNATIIAHEKMSAFAYITVFDGVCKLLIAWIICYCSFDKLIMYALLLALVSIIIRYLYGSYCNRNFEECKYKFVLEKKMLYEMFSFAGWNLIGATSAVLRDHGGNLILNLFFGPVVNAARGVAIQVSSAVQGFVSNFQTALNPQIIKAYASNDRDYMMKLVFQGARFSYYILFLIALPILINTDYILNVWLENPPEHTSNFLRLIIWFSLCECLSGPLMTSMYATGNVRNYQIVVGGCQMINLPLAYICLYMGFPAESVFIIAIVVSVFCLLCRLVMLKSMIGLSPIGFLLKVLGNVIVVSVISMILPYALNSIWSSSFWNFIFISIVSLVSTLIAIMFLGCNKSERIWLFNKLHDTLNKKR